MAHDPQDDSEPSPARAPGRLMLFAGVAGACALGVGAGLWARPLDTERDPRGMHVAKVAEPEKPAGKLQIVVDEAPAPIGKPIEVLPGSEPSRPAFFLPPPPAEPDPIAPSRPPEGLMRVQSVAPVAPPVDPAAVKLASQRLAERAAKAEQARLEKIKAEKAEQARLEKASEIRAEKAEAARAEKVRLEKVKLETAKLQKTKMQRAERAKIERQARAEAKAELLAEQKATKAKQTKLAKAKAAKAEAEAVELAEAKRSALTKLAHAFSRAVRHEKAVELAAKKAKAEPVRGEGPLRLASYKHGGNSRCVSADPGAAIVCADPALASADKQLARAYQQAQAAGVSPDQLRRQQDRWLAARSAAAREAPWAVHDVYLARIAELNDQARDARGGGY